MTARASKSQSNNQISVDLAVMANKVDNIDTTVKDIQRKLEGEYITKDQFEPIQRIVYGMVSLVLVAVFGALVALVIQQ